MKNIEFGKFIQNLRTKNGISEEELAKSLNISLNKLKKIEKGQTKVTTEIIWNLHKFFGVSVDELLDIYTEDNKNNTHDKLLIMLSDEKRKYKKFKRIILTLFSLFIIGITILNIYLYNNRDWGYILKGESDNFRYNNVMFIHDNDTYYLMFGDLEFNNDKISKDNIDYVELKCNERLIIGSSSILTGYTRENKGYDELFPKDVAKNIDNWYYEISYSVDGEKFTERIDLVSKSL